ncbi:hypothetical protein BGW80DRAFT_888591 [Lactifluus volemus]|nr:hypothetical protein BGW80DRAFT_888591 [Lactifluus volemus]
MLCIPPPFLFLQLLHTSPPVRQASPESFKLLQSMLKPCQFTRHSISSEDIPLLSRTFRTQLHVLYLFELIVHASCASTLGTTLTLIPSPSARLSVFFPSSFRWHHYVAPYSPL